MDFTKLKWRINEIPFEVKITEVYPELAEIFKEHIQPLEDLGSFDIFARYIIYCYHKGSPLIAKMLEDVRARKRKALDLAGVDLTAEGNQELINSILNNECEAVGYAVLQFLKFENSIGHLQICLQTEALCQYNYELIDAKKGADKTQTVKAISDLTTLLDRIKAQHFKMDNDMGDFTASYQIIENRRITPEDEVMYQKQKSK